MNQVRYVLLMITLVALVGVSALALDVPNSFVSGEVISAADMNANFAAVEAAFAELEAAQPIVAHGTASASLIPITSTTDAEDVVTVTLDAPAEGVVLVQAMAQLGLYGTDDGNSVAVQIDTVEGGALTGNGPNEFIVGYFDAPGIERIWVPTAMQRAFEVTAGPQTYRLEAVDRTGLGSKYFWNATITATWYPAERAAIQVPVAALGAPGASNLR